MFSDTNSELISVLNSFLGEPKHNYATDTQLQFCCPCCAERKGVESDNKYNLECNLTKGVYKCWVCGDTDGMKGRLSKLIKKYGNAQLLSEYKHIVKELKESSLYSLSKNENYQDDFVDDFEELHLPQNYTLLNTHDPYATDAISYLDKRGLNEWFIKTYKIGYIANSSDYKMKKRIIIPSFGKFGELNYWVGRDYTGKNPIRYKNPPIEKKNFIFNEELINWYDNITLVEGVFDHMVVPNSIPLLGKTLNKEFALYDKLVNCAKQNINIFLDDDAYDNAIKLYKLLNQGNLKGRIRMIGCPQGFDASSLYEKYGKGGIVRVMRTAKMLDDFI